MSNNIEKSLLAEKQNLLAEIKYYERRIEDFANENSTNFYHDDSSDSEGEIFPIIDRGPMLLQLSQELSKYKTLLQATQELTNLQILQSECNCMVEDPVLDREPPVTEPGVWYEVTADCRFDLVPFSIMFHYHEPSRKFAQRSYRSLRVMPVKRAHETELARSVLHALVTPMDAVTVMKSYSVAFRSRRTTLAKLAEKYADALFMEPKSDGGYILRCADVLEVSWCLENKWTPIAPFHHRMKCEVEYMDEAFIKIIKQAHDQLSDPTISTDERTLLLSKIIATCLEAQRINQETTDSETDTVRKVDKRRTTLDQEIEAPSAKKKKENEVMAPPKSLPKKSKAKSAKADDKTEKKSTQGRQSVRSSKSSTLPEQNNLNKHNNVTDEVSTGDTVKKSDKNQKEGDNPQDKDMGKEQNMAAENTEKNVANAVKNVAAAKKSTNNVNEKNIVSEKNVPNVIKSAKNSAKNSKENDKPQNTNIVKEKSKIPGNIENNVQNLGNNAKKMRTLKETDKPPNTNMTKEKTKVTGNVANNIQNSTSNVATVKKATKNTKENNKLQNPSTVKDKKKVTDTTKNLVQAIPKNVATAKKSVKNVKENNPQTANVIKEKKVTDNTKKTKVQENLESNKGDDKNKNGKSSKHDKNDIQNVETDKVIEKNAVKKVKSNIANIIENPKPKTVNDKPQNVEKAVENSDGSKDAQKLNNQKKPTTVKNNENRQEVSKKTKPNQITAKTDKVKKSIHEIFNKPKNNDRLNPDKMIKKLPSNTNIHAKTTTAGTKLNTGRTSHVGNTEKENSSLKQRNSKIPRMVNKGTKFPLRISPRKMPLKYKNQLQDS